MAVFSVDAIHREHWNAFCDVCYSHFEFEEEEDGERTYEQKYDTFRRCYNFAQQHFKWNEVLWFKVGQQDFERLKKAYDFFLNLTTDDNASVPMLMVLLRIQQSIWTRLKKDSELMEYVYPRRFKVDYYKYRIEQIENLPNDDNLIKDLGKVEHQIIDALYNERPWDEEWRRLINDSKVHHVDERQGESKERDVSAGNLAQALAESIIHSYNHSIYEFSSKHYHTVTEGDGSAIRALVFRLFTSFQISLPDIKTLLDDYPECLWYDKLNQTRDELIREFEKSRLGSHWCECITSKSGLGKVGRYLINHRDVISEEEETRFFYLLDEICIITDILRGNAAKYWLKLDYEDDKVDKEMSEKEELNYFAPCKNLQELLKGVWFAEVRSDEKYDAAWTDSFVGALMQSEHGEGIARQWGVQGVRNKRKQLKGYVVGLLKDQGVLVGSYNAIAAKIDPDDKKRVFSHYMGDGKKQPYAEWVKDYVVGN